MTGQEEDFDEDLDEDGFRVTDFFEGFTAKRAFNASSNFIGLKDMGFSLAMRIIVRSRFSSCKVLGLVNRLSSTSSHWLRGKGDQPVSRSLLGYSLGDLSQIGKFGIGVLGGRRLGPFLFPIASSFLQWASHCSQRGQPHCSPWRRSITGPYWALPETKTKIFNLRSQLGIYAWHFPCLTDLFKPRSIRQHEKLPQFHSSSLVHMERLLPC